MQFIVITRVKSHETSRFGGANDLAVGRNPGDFFFFIFRNSQNFRTL